VVSHPGDEATIGAAALDRCDTLPRLADPASPSSKVTPRFPLHDPPSTENAATTVHAAGGNGGVDTAPRAGGVCRARLAALNLR
jgi:hypothetical protein